MKVPLSWLRAYCDPGLPAEELAEETRLIRARYADPKPVLFPATVTWIVPARLAR